MDIISGNKTMEIKELEKKCRKTSLLITIVGGVFLSMEFIYIGIFVIAFLVGSPIRDMSSYGVVLLGFPIFLMLLALVRFVLFKTMFMLKRGILRERQSLLY